MESKRCQQSLKETLPLVKGEGGSSIRESNKGVYKKYTILFEIASKNVELGGGWKERGGELTITVCYAHVQICQNESLHL